MLRLISIFFASILVLFVNNNGCMSVWFFCVCGKDKVNQGSKSKGLKRSAKQEDKIQA